MKPSLLRIFASSTFSFDDGSSIRSCRDVMPLRILVSMSAIGSVIDIRDSVFSVPSAECHSALMFLPARFGDAGDVAAEREQTEADAAKLKLAQKAAGTAALFAAVDFAGHELRLPLRLDDHGNLGH